jgi:hypothetical protein
MKRNIHLQTSVDKPETLEDIIEQLATRHYDMGYGNAKVPTFLQAIDTSSVESYISGNVEFDYNETQRIRVPYITGFLFSCRKGKNDPYDLVWSLSLS